MSDFRKPFAWCQDCRTYFSESLCACADRPPLFEFRLVIRSGVPLVYLDAIDGDGELSTTVYPRPFNVPAWARTAFDGWRAGFASGHGAMSDSREPPHGPECGWTPDPLLGDMIRLAARSRGHGPVGLLAQAAIAAEVRRLEAHFRECKRAPAPPPEES